MITSVNSIRKDRMPSILQSVHDEIIENLKKEEKIEQAREIESILREVKRVAQISSNHTSGSAVLTKAEKQIHDIIENAWRQQQLRNPGLDPTIPFFRRQHDESSTISEADDIFEQELGFLIQAAAKMEKINVNIKMLLSGQESVTTSSMQNLTKELEQKMLSIANKAIENQVKTIEARNKIKNKITIRAGKIDINVPSFQVTSDAQDEVNKLLKVFSGATFTVKNYSTKDNPLSKTTIELGNSNIYKGITGPLSEVFSDIDIQNHIFYRGMQILAGETKNNSPGIQDAVNRHFAHLRFMYELRGMGLLDTSTGQKRVADFIIWNDPTSEKISVRSTAEVLVNEIFSSSRKKPFSIVTIAASRIYTNPIKS